MVFKNKDGTPVDPIPFFIVSIMAFTIIFTFGPPYFLALGLRLEVALAACTAIVCISTVTAYYRYVWTTRPTTRAEVPGPVRLKRLFYAILAGFLLVALLALPLLGKLR